MHVRTRMASCCLPTRVPAPPRKGMSMSTPRPFSGREKSAAARSQRARSERENCTVLTTPVGESSSSRSAGGYAQAASPPLRICSKERRTRSMLKRRPRRIASADSAALSTGSLRRPAPTNDSMLARRPRRTAAVASLGKPSDSRRWAPPTSSPLGDISGYACNEPRRFLLRGVDASSAPGSLESIVCR